MYSGKIAVPPGGGVIVQQQQNALFCPTGFWIPDYKT
jgi:hypothetical protein